VDNGRVESSAANGIGTITFSHPKGNSLPASVLADLSREIVRLGADDAVKVIVLRSEGTGAFCAGASFSELKEIADEKSGKEFLLGFARVILAMIRCPKFIITRVQGKVVGGGVGILAASDYTIATEACSLRLSELAVGIGPFVVGPVIEKKIALAGFSQLAVSSGWRHAAWARTHGLYSELHGSVEEVDAAVAALASTLAASNPEAMSRLKEVFWAGTNDWDGLLDERAAANLCYTSATTGNPKGVVFSHRSTRLHALIAALPDALNCSQRDTILPIQKQHQIGEALAHKQRLAVGHDGRLPLVEYTFTGYAMQRGIPYYKLSVRSKVASADHHVKEFTTALLVAIEGDGVKVLD